MIGFKFQSDSINTTLLAESSALGRPLNSNLILLIRRRLALNDRHRMEPLNSNLILLIPVFKDTFKTTGYNTYFCRPKK